MVEGMLPPEMVAETVTLMRKGIEKGVKMKIIINNRTGGNVPLIAKEIVNHFFKV
jgi:hypothetical protein